TSAQILGSGTSGMVFDINDLHQVVGGSGTAWLYDPTFGMVNLGGGEAQGIDPLGTLVTGQNANGITTAWVRQPNNAWLPEALPRPSGSVGGSAWHMAPTSDGLIVAGWDDIPGARRSSANLSRPALWRRGTDGVWSAPMLFPIP